MGINGSLWYFVHEYNIFWSCSLPQFFLVFLISAEAFSLPNYYLFHHSVFLLLLLFLPSALLLPIHLLCLPLYLLLLSDPLNSISVVYRSVGEVLFIKALTLYHWIYSWRQCLSRSQHPWPAFLFLGKDGVPPFIDRANLVLVITTVESSWVQQPCMPRRVSYNTHPFLSLPVFLTPLSGCFQSIWVVI